MDAVRRAIADEIRAERGRKRMSHADLIRRSGLSGATIATIEGAERDVELDQLEAIAGALGVTAVTLMQRAQNSLTCSE
ncbi:helix-turn-helix domain-containing protein [Rhodococcus sp. T2V]|uniref:helix-turn-helix domain-containing protein n=1 Tax=Rhodococcus sp. T2V TaxID=3034164 RepID=UPI0023E1AEFF|nr:helix-turn-helix transcriptional regulator [Rhodococcus sp. T2V]